MVILFTITIFLAALLLFWVQPLVGRMLLPLFGGAPAVWNTAMVFYQAALLAGYAYAHFATRRFGARRQLIVHAFVLLLPLIALPIAIPRDALQKGIVAALYERRGVASSGDLQTGVDGRRPPLQAEVDGHTRRQERPTGQGGKPPLQGEADGHTRRQERPRGQGGKPPLQREPTAALPPVPMLLALLIVAVGLPFFVVSATGPLLQRWFSRSGHRNAADPYFLYAASNAGSLLALVSYPVLIEPHLRLGDQSRWWTIGYGVLAALTVVCGWWVWRKGESSGDVAGDEEAGTRPTGSRQECRSYETEEKATPSRQECRSYETEAATPSRQECRSYEREENLTPRRRWRWMLLAFVPCSLMLSVTTYVTSEIAPVPLLWVIPLGIYLLTFILVFARHRLVPQRWMTLALPCVVLALLMVLAQTALRGDPIRALAGPVALHFAGLFVIAMVCHGELAKDRPAVSHLTEFYLWISVGGVLGGMFNALLAPVIFSTVLEYPVTLLLACLVRPGRGSLGGRAEGIVAASLLAASELDGSPPSASRLAATNTQPANPQTASRLAATIPRRRKVILALDLVLPVLLGAATFGLVLLNQSRGIASPWVRVAIECGLPGLVCLWFMRRPIRFALGALAILLSMSAAARWGIHNALVARSFFGIHRVELVPGQEHVHLLWHGTTLHGMQSFDSRVRRTPLVYFTRTGPLGQAMAAFPAELKQRVAVVGLGAGAIACYGDAGERWTFYEIDPLVERMARDPRYFTYLQDCPAAVNIVLGDARLSLEAAADGEFGLMIFDAYNSDTIPLHLVTREALALYRRKLAPGGALVFHISNRHIDLEPVFANLARDAGLVALCRRDRSTQAEWEQQGKRPSCWVVMSRDPQRLGPLAADQRWRPPREQGGVGVWTDDYASVFKVFRWR